MTINGRESYYRILFKYVSKSRQTNKIAYNNISIVPYTLIAILPRIVPLISSCTLRLNLAQARPIYHLHNIPRYPWNSPQIRPSFGSNAVWNREQPVRKRCGGFHIRKKAALRGRQDLFQGLHKSWMAPGRRHYLRNCLFFHDESSCFLRSFLFFIDTRSRIILVVIDERKRREESLIFIRRKQKPGLFGELYNRVRGDESWYF